MHYNSKVVIRWNHFSDLVFSDLGVKHRLLEFPGRLTILQRGSQVGGLVLLRFRNPSTNIETQIAVFSALHTALKDKPSFTTDDMAKVITNLSLATAYGHSGDRAAAISASRTVSKNSIKMNAKMYAEVFRLYGWVSPATRDSSYPIRFTLVGACAASSRTGAIELLKQSMLGYVNPSDINTGAKYDENVRFFALALKTLRDLGGRMYKHELCLGPMSCDDNSDEPYLRMLEAIRALRGDFSKLESAFENHCQSLSMQNTSVDNMTRLPIALLKGVGWVDTGVVDFHLYNKKITCIEITQFGLKQLEELDQMTEFRLSNFRDSPDDKKPALVRLGVYSMLERAGFDLDAVTNVVESDRKTLSRFLGDKEFLFSPYQTIYAGDVDQMLGVGALNEPLAEVGDRDAIDKLTRQIGATERSDLLVTLTKHMMTESPTDSLNKSRPSETAIRNQIQELSKLGSDEQEITERLFGSHRNAKQDSFYPLVADLFSIIGLPCRESRAGDNGARWDAVIADSEFSIPIEIKSPSEEMHLSLKAVRQAFENKVILLSRKTYASNVDVTSLAVGYELPNNRSEVEMLISDIHETFAIRIGVIGFRGLVRLAVEAVIHQTTPAKREIQILLGVLDVDI